jgi:hypothetical protein
VKRREFLQCAALLTAGTSIAPPSWSLSREQSDFLAARASYIDRPLPGFFSELQRAAVAASAERIVPRTDTPGALDAGAPRFIELMVADWFTDSERERFMAGLDLLQRRAGGDFAALSPDDQLELLEALEDEAGDAPWYRIGNTLRIWDEEAPFICQLKELTVLGFMLSEVGSKQFLRPNPMGSFDGSLPLAPGDRSYDKHTMIRMIAKESN